MTALNHRKPKGASSRAIDKVAGRRSAAVPAASSGSVPPPGSSGGLPPGSGSRTGTVRELAGADACATGSSARHPKRAGRLDEIQDLRAQSAAELEELERPALLAVQRELEESRERYADLYDFAPVGYLTLDFNGCLRDLNLVGARLLGVERRHLMGRPLLPMVQRGERANFLEHLSRLRRGQSPVTTELAIVTRHGPTQMFQLISIAKRPGLASPIEFRTALVDITERRRTADALHQNSQMLEALVRSSPLAVVMVDRHLRVQLWNPAAERLFGWKESEVLGQRLPIIPWNQQARFRSLLVAEMEGRCLIGEEAQRQRKDGSLVEVSASSAPLWDSQGQVAAFVRIYEDITQRKRTEHALRQAHETLEQRVAERTAELAQSNQRLRQEIAERQQAEAARRESEIRFQAILDNSPAIIFLKDTQGRYLHCNRRFEQVFHVPLSQVVGKTDAEIFPPAQAAVFRANDLKVIQTGLPLQADEVALHDDGPHTSIVSKFPLFDLNGHVYGIAGIVTDITERKRLEAEVLHISELERQRIGQDLHDGVCQLLAGIRWKHQSLQEELAGRGAGPSRRGARITHLLFQAVEQARAVAHGLQPIESAPDGLMRALRNLAALTRDLFGVKCACHIPRPILVQDHGVATDLLRIAQEAVNNAIKHGKARKVRLELARNGGHLVLKVANDGKSFPDRPRSSGVGLKTMNYRTLRIGATFQIGPGPGLGPHRGTIVQCALPLSKVISNGDPAQELERRAPARRDPVTGPRRAGARRSLPVRSRPARKNSRRSLRD